MTFDNNEKGNLNSENRSLAEGIFDQETIQVMENQIIENSFVLFKRNYLQHFLNNLPLIILVILCISTTTWLLNLLITSQNEMALVYFLTKSQWRGLFYLMQIVTLFLLIYLPIILPLRLRKLPTGIAITPKGLQIKSRKSLDQEILWGDIAEITIWRGMQEVTNEKIPIHPLKNYRVKIYSNKSELIINTKEYFDNAIDIIPKFDSFELAYQHRKYDVLTLIIEHFYQKYRNEV